MAEKLTNRPISKEIERERQDVVRVLRPFFLTTAMVDADTGVRHDIKWLKKTVQMDGTSKEFTFSSSYAFKSPEAAFIFISPRSLIAMWAEMTAGHRFKITAASAVAAITVDVLMGGY